MIKKIKKPEKIRVFADRKKIQESKYSVEILNNKWIKIFISDKEINHFKIGQKASYGRYNLIYIGNITYISGKRIQIKSYSGGPKESIHNLSIYDFCLLNDDFDEFDAEGHNLNEMLYI